MKVRRRRVELPADVVAHFAEGEVTVDAEPHLRWPEGGCATVVGFACGVAHPGAVVAEHVEPTYGVRVCAAHARECGERGLTCVQEPGLCVGLHPKTRWARYNSEHGKHGRRTPKKRDHEVDEDPSSPRRVVLTGRAP